MSKVAKPAAAPRKASGRPPARERVVQDVDAVRLQQSISKLSRHLRAIDGASGLTPTQASLLVTVVRLGPIGLSELSRFEGINATLLSRSVASLEARGLVRRSVDKHDRRAASLGATPAGSRLHRRLREARSDALRGHLERLTGADQRRLAAALPVLEQLVDRVNAERRPSA